MAEAQNLKKCLVLADIIRLTRPPEYTILFLVVWWKTKMRVQEFHRGYLKHGSEVLLTVPLVPAGKNREVKTCW